MICLIWKKNARRKFCLQKNAGIISIKICSDKYLIKDELEYRETLISVYNLMSIVILCYSSQ